MEKECSHGAMENNLTVTTLKTRKMDMDNLHGLMGRFIKDSGRMVNNMVREL